MSQRSRRRRTRATRSRGSRFAPAPAARLTVDRRPSVDGRRNEQSWRWANQRACSAQLRLSCAAWLPPPSRLRGLERATRLRGRVRRGDLAARPLCHPLPCRGDQQLVLPAASLERWASSTPPDFAFSVILPQAITHETRLVRAMPVFDPFWDQVQGLGERLRCLLVQLSPSLAYDSRVAGRFGAALRRRYAGPVEIEPRHASWFTHQVDALLASWRFGRVLADPVRMTRERHRADGCGPSTCVCTDRRACIGSATKTHCSACSRRDCGGGRRCRALLVHFRQFRGRPIRRRRASARRDDWMVHQMRKAGPPFEPLGGAAVRNGDSSAVVADLDMSTLPQGKGHVHTAGRLCGSCEEVRWIRRSGSRATR